MKICGICLKNDFLCNACRKKIDSGQVSKGDVTVSRTLFKLDIFANFIRSIETKDCIIIVADKKDAAILIGRGGRNAKKIAQALGKNARIIEQVDDEKKMIENIISRPVLGINKIYGDGETYKVRIENRFRKRVGEMSPMVAKVIGKNVKFIFE